MRYIYYILGIVVLLSCAVLGSAVLSTQSENGPNDLLVNELRLSAQELLQRWEQRPYHLETKQEFLDELINKQLLVDQAIKEGIANEDAFKRSVQAFFEQSLIRTLLERKMATLEFVISAPELAAMRQAQKQRYSLTLIRSGQESETPSQGPEPQLQQRFMDLPEALKLAVLSLQPGEVSAPLIDGGGALQVRIDRIEALEEPLVGQESDSQLEQSLRIARQQQALDLWMVELNKHARIEYPKAFVTREDLR